MKSFKEYLVESKKVYEFKVRFAGEIKPESLKKIKIALEQFKLERCSSPRRTPIHESPIDFPSLKNTNVTIFDVTLGYPTTSAQVKNAIAGCGFSDSQISVRNLKEEEEDTINHKYDNKSGEALLGKDYEANNDGQSLVGEKQQMSLIKELSKSKHAGEAYTGVNDQLLAKSTHRESARGESKTPKKTTSIVGNKKVKLPTAKGV